MNDVWRRKTIDNRYRLTEVIGYGCYGSVVMKANRIPDGEVFAVKIWDQKGMDADIHDVATKAMELQAFRHPHIVRIEEVLTWSRYVFMVMEYVSGVHLEKYMSSFSMNEKRRIFQQVVDAIEFMHDHHCYRCDIKLCNIMLTEDRNVKLINFHMEEGAGVRNVFTVPNQYDPPQFCGGGYSRVAIDIWSLGVTLYALAKEEFPFPHDRDFRSGHSQIDLCGLPCALKELILGMLDWNPDERYTFSQIRENEWFREGYSRIDGNMARDVRPITVINEGHAFDIIGKVAMLGMETMLIPEDVGMTRTYLLQDNAVSDRVCHFFEENGKIVKRTYDNDRFEVRQDDDDHNDELICYYNVLFVQDKVLFGISRVGPETDEFKELLERLTIQLQM